METSGKCSCVLTLINHHQPSLCPAYYWKVLYDRDANQAVAFLGSNDIYAEDTTTYLCPTVCDQLDKWVKFDYEDETHGHVTCCSLESFANVVSFAPDLRDENGNWPDLLV